MMFPKEQVIMIWKKKKLNVNEEVVILQPQWSAYLSNLWDASIRRYNCNFLHGEQKAIVYRRVIVQKYDVQI